MSRILPGGLLCVALLWVKAGTAADGARETEELGRILPRLLSAENDLTGQVVTARQTNVTYTQHGPLQAVLNARTNFSRKAVADAEAIAAGFPSVVTNITAYSYRFGPETRLTTALEEDDRGQPKTEKRTLATAEYLLQSQVSLQPRSDGKPTVPDGTISRRAAGIGGGWPLWLSRGTLGEAMKRSASVTCSVDRLPDGERCYILKLLGTTNTPIAKMVLVLTTVDLKPLELSCYLADGTIYSRAKLDFGADAEQPGLCRAATSEQFMQGHLYRRSVWHLESVARDKSSPSDKLDEFFPPLTAVADERFSRPITYRVGSRLPHDSETEAMLTNRHAIARFEAKTLSRSLLPATVSPPQHQPVRRFVALFALALTSLLCLVVYWFIAKPGRTGVD